MAVDKASGGKRDEKAGSHQGAGDNVGVKCALSELLMHLLHGGRRAAGATAERSTHDLDERATLAHGIAAAMELELGACISGPHVVSLELSGPRRGVRHQGGRGGPGPSVDCMGLPADEAGAAAPPPPPLRCGPKALLTRSCNGEASGSLLRRAPTRALLRRRPRRSAPAAGYCVPRPAAGALRHGGPDRYCAAAARRAPRGVPVPPPVSCAAARGSFICHNRLQLGPPCRGAKAAPTKRLLPPPACPLALSSLNCPRAQTAAATSHPWSSYDFIGARRCRSSLSHSKASMPRRLRVAQCLSRSVGITPTESAAALAAAGGELDVALRRELLRVPLATEHIRRLVLEYAAARGLSAGTLASRAATPSPSRDASRTGATPTTGRPDGGTGGVPEHRNGASSLALGHWQLCLPSSNARAILVNLQSFIACQS